MNITFLGVVRCEAPANADAGYGRRLWLAERIKPTDTVIDMGGTGGMLDFHNPELVTCLDDLSGFGPGHKLDPKQKFIHGDVCRRMPGAWDVALLCEVIEHVGEPWRAIDNACLAAKKVLITTPCEQRWQNPAQYRVSGHIRFSIPELFVGQLRRSLACSTAEKIEYGLLEFGTWSFLVAEIC